MGLTNLVILAHVASAAASVIEVNSSSMVRSAGAAALAACSPSAPHALALAQTKLSLRLRGSSSRSLEEASSSKELMQSISEEILGLQQELDDAHLACEADKRTIQLRISQLENGNSQVAQDVSSMEAKIASSAGELQPTTEKIQQLRDQVQKKRVQCEKDGKELNSTDLPEHLRVIKAQRLEAECRNSVRTMNDNLREKVSHLAKQQVSLTQTIAMKAQFQEQMKEADQQMASLVRRSKEMERDCREKSEQFQREMCGLAEIRQSIFWKFESDETGKMIQDCKVTDWITGPCSKACVDSKDGEPGTQLLTREVSVEAEDHGTACPALSRSIKCNAGLLCPVDCKMSEWSGWAKCSRRCGGGEQYRTRSVLQYASGGGSVCGVTAESQLCNIGACFDSCEFAEWSPWGPCSRRCKWSEDSEGGHSSRKRAVVTESSPGACKAEDARQTQTCNTEDCPSDTAALNCTEPQDILVVLDGSETAESESSFGKAKGLVKELVEHSSFADDESLLRYGFVLFGTENKRPKVISTMKGKKQALLTALDADDTAFAGGSSNVAGGLTAAAQVSRLATYGDKPLRQETVVLITGNRLSTDSGTATMSERLRAVGLRIIVVQVGEIDNPSVHGDEFACQIASSPCVDNWLRIKSWDRLSDSTHLGLFLSTICPVGHSS